MNSVLGPFRSAVNWLKRVGRFLGDNRRLLLTWLFILAFVATALHFGWDKKAIAFLVVVFGILSQAFLGLIGLIAMIPVIGPILAKVLALPLYWVLNALGYFLSVFAIKKGHGKSVLNYRILTIVFLVGVAFGFVLGKLL
ncbi:MAG: hypothetical protein D6715_13335 [Calditrichaeota bacterium]|nr:MAG: hypothetical protein D6715_13335 [Calditrichota bacterium]